MSDRSSNVCSSDLRRRGIPAQTKLLQLHPGHLHDLYVKQHHAIPTHLSGEVQQLRIALGQLCNAFPIAIGQLVSFDHELLANHRDPDMRDAFKYAAQLLLYLSRSSWCDVQDRKSTRLNSSH